MRSKHDLKTPGSLVGLGLALGGLAFGTFLAQRRKGGSDDAPIYTRKSPPGEHAVLGRTVTIRKPRAELYSFWRDFQNLPKFMENVETIRSQGDRSTWVIKAPGGSTVDVETRVSDERENERIAWQSTENSDIRTSGRVEFTDAPGERGTRVSLIMSYDPPGGAAGRALAKLFMREPEVQARHDLKRFKALMETGEITTSARRRDETREAKQQENG
ncbi:SRPBCC family protein [Aurantiacibacter hainanensis]|uniref:SRPBCC family protein n=1 Tax=Aurantiacibacter hainanensis TaxID=3076114 RepID=UPI0030C68A17